VVASLFARGLWRACSSRWSWLRVMRLCSLSRSLFPYYTQRGRLCSTRMRRSMRRVSRILASHRCATPRRRSTTVLPSHLVSNADWRQRCLKRGLWGRRVNLYPLDPQRLPSATPTSRRTRSLAVSDGRPSRAQLPPMSPRTNRPHADGPATGTCGSLELATASSVSEGHRGPTRFGGVSTSASRRRNTVHTPHSSSRGRATMTATVCRRLFPDAPALVDGALLSIKNTILTGRMPRSDGSDTRRPVAVN